MKICFPFLVHRYINIKKGYIMSDANFIDVAKLAKFVVKNKNDLINTL